MSTNKYRHRIQLACFALGRTTPLAPRAVRLKVPLELYKYFFGSL
jgi:hypothetical protein